MNAEGIEQAKRELVRSKARLASTLGALQLRLRPSSLAGEAWDGVKEKGADMADGALEAVKSRPATVSAALGALAVFLAREPLKRGVAKLLSGDKDETRDDRLTTRIETASDKFSMSAPVVGAPVTKGASEWLPKAKKKAGRKPPSRGAARPKRIRQPGSAPRQPMRPPEIEPAT